MISPPFMPGVFMIASPRRRRSSRGFTLIEILVSCAVLAALVALLASTFSNFVGLTTASGKRLETSNQNRTVFDRMAFDLGSSVRTASVDIDFRKDRAVTSSATGRNDSFSLLVDTRSTAADSRLARIAYEVGPDSNAATGTAMTSLLRCVEPFAWGDNILHRTPTSNAERQPLGRGVFRLELSFLLNTGRIVADLTGVEPSDVVAVICSTASLDEGTFSQLTDTQVAQLVSNLPDAVDDRLPLTDWKIENLPAGLPSSALKNIRFNQRQFYLQ